MEQLYNKKYTIFLEFLKFCLNPQSEVPESVSEINWMDLFDFAKKQTIVGVYANTILFDNKRLDDVDWHGNKLNCNDVIVWLALYNKIQKLNRLIYSKCQEVSCKFKNEGFKSCVLKGQGNALMYPDIYSRTPGDIDLWVNGGMKKVISYVSMIHKPDMVLYHHIDFCIFQNVPVEVHYRPTYLNNPFKNQLFQTWVKDNENLQFSNRVNVPNTQCFFCVPTKTFNYVYQLAHIMHHFFDDGIGLRQLIDYYYLLKMGVDDNEKQIVNKEIKKFGMLSFTRAVMFILKDILGLDSKFLIIEPDEKLGIVLLEEIVKGGNFGKEYHIKNINSIKRHFIKIKRVLRLISVCPSESLWEPWFRTYHFFWRIKHR